jgi:hypothetical protein
MIADLETIPASMFVAVDSWRVRVGAGGARGALA